MKSLTALTLTVLVLGLAVTASAASKAKPATKAGQGEVPEVIVTGCVTKGSVNFCWNLDTADGASYSFAGQPAVGGKCYTVTGKQTVGFCHKGTQLGVSSLVVSATNCCEKH